MSLFMLFSLVILAFLIFMVVVLLYISKAVKNEINQVQIQLLTQFSIEYAQELYSFNDMKTEDCVEKVINVMERIRQDWDLDVEYNKWEIENKVRNYIKKKL